MSFLGEQELLCPGCKIPFQAEIWSGINASDDPELKDILMGGELNMVECNSCRHVFYADRFLLYHEPDKELLGFVYPFEYRHERGKWEKQTQDNFLQTQELTTPHNQLGYGPVTLFGLDELVQTITKEEDIEIQSEIAGVLSQQSNFAIQKLRPSVARRQNVPLVLPYLESNGHLSNKGLKKAVEEILKQNDRLTVYQKLKQKLEVEPQFVIDFQ